MKQLSLNFLKQCNNIDSKTKTLSNIMKGFKISNLVTKILFSLEKTRKLIEWGPFVQDLQYTGDQKGTLGRKGTIIDNLKGFI